jgi:hypothetical protein
MKFKFLIFVAVYLLSFVATADVIPTDEDQDVQSPKHEVLPESSPSSPPLASDDPGTPGPQGIEVNFYTNLDSFKGGHLQSSGIDANYGVGEYVQLRISKEALHEKMDDQPEFYGYGPTSVGVKWRFYDSPTNSFKMAVYPSYQFNDKTHEADSDPEGRSLYLPILASKTFGRYTILANAGLTKNFDYWDKNSNFLSLALGRSFSDTLRLMTEVASENTSEDNHVDLRVGFVKEIFPNETSKYETAVFGSVGRSVAWSNDEANHFTALIGLSIAVKPIETHE